MEGTAFSLPNPLSPSVCRELTNSVARAYADIARTHDPKVGNDAITFGITVGRAVWYRLGERFTGYPLVAVDHPDGAFELNVSGYVLHPFKLGNTVEDNVWTSFPWNERSAHRMASLNAEQLGFGFMGEAKQYVLGHFGSPQGFAKLYICVPMFDRAGRIFQWAAAVRIDDLVASYQPVARPAPAPIAPPRVELRPVPLSDDEADVNEGPSSPHA